MTEILSHRHVRFVINGHTVEGWSDDDPPIDFPQVELIEETIGKDGTLFASDTGMLGGEVTVKLLPTSRSAMWLLQQLALRQNGARIIYEADYYEIERGFAVSCLGGVLKSCPPTVVPGETFEATFYFEQLLPQPNATFAAAPVSTF